jgi:two-component system cell cycle response regulator
MDALSDLANRGGLEKHLAAAWGSSQRHGAALSIAFIDIDAFKQINDRGGHEAGDRVIRAVADVLRLNARLTDHVGRWGGDEFMVVMPHNDAEAAALAMQRLRERVLEAGIEVPPGCPALTLSIGIATRHADDDSVHALVKRADAEMYRRKRQRGLSYPVEPPQGARLVA